MNVVFIVVFGHGLIRTQKMTTNVAFIVVFFARGQDYKKKTKEKKINVDVHLLAIDV